MIEVILKSNISQRVLKASYTARQLLEMSEEDIVEKMAMYDCQPIGETNVVDCNCCEEWDDYTMIVGNENNYNGIDDIPKTKELDTKLSRIWREINNAYYFADIRKRTFYNLIHEIAEIIKPNYEEIGKEFIE